MLDGDCDAVVCGSARSLALPLGFLLRHFCLTNGLPRAPICGLLLVAEVATGFAAPREAEKEPKRHPAGTHSPSVDGHALAEVEAVGRTDLL
eukprot:8063971-Pyramimonas_sp.AAC.1